jgi:hypothetical protein
MYGKNSQYEQFENFLNFLQKIYLSLHFFFFSNIFVSFATLCVIFSFFLKNTNNASYIFPKTFLYYTILFLYNLILKLLNDQINAKIKYSFVKLLILVFLIIAFSNFLSILPYSFASTGQFIIAISLSFNLFL